MRKYEKNRMTCRQRLDAITRKAATVGGITDAERDEWHRLLVAAANSPQSDPVFRGMFTGAPAYLDSTTYPHARPLRANVQALSECMGESVGLTAIDCAEANEVLNSYLGPRGE